MTISFILKKVVKPIVEVKMKQTHNKKTQVTEIKYFSLNIQESFIKIDLISINALLNFFNDQVKYALFFLYKNL